MFNMFNFGEKPTIHILDVAKLYWQVDSHCLHAVPSWLSKFTAVYIVYM